MAVFVFVTGCQRTLHRGPFGGAPAALPASVTDGVWVLSPLRGSEDDTLQIAFESSGLGCASGSLFETRSGSSSTKVRPWSAIVRSGPDGFYWVTVLSFGDKADNEAPYYPIILLRFENDRLACAWLPHLRRVGALVREGKIHGSVPGDSGDLKLETFGKEQQEWLSRTENLSRFVKWEMPVVALRKSRKETEASPNLPNIHK